MGMFNTAFVSLDVMEINPLCFSYTSTILSIREVDGFVGFTIWWCLSAWVWGFEEIFVLGFGSEENSSDFCYSRVVVSASIRRPSIRQMEFEMQTREIVDFC